MSGGPVVEACATTQHKVLNRLPGKCQSRPEVVHVGLKRSAIAAVDVDLRAGIRDAVYGIADVRIKVLLPVKALVPSSKDIPAQSGGDGQALRRVKSILDEGCIIRIGLGGEDIFGEVGVIVLFVAGELAHANQQRSEIAATRDAGHGLIGGTDVKGIRASRRGRLADVEISFHPFETKRDRMPALHLREGGAGIAVLTGIDKVVVVGCAANTSANIVKVHKGELFEDYF